MNERVYDWVIYIHKYSGRFACKPVMGDSITIPGRAVDVIKGTRSEAIAICERKECERAAEAAQTTGLKAQKGQ